MIVTLVRTHYRFLCFIPANTIVPERKGLLESYKIVKDVSDEMINKTKGTALYQQLPVDCMDTLKECEPQRNSL